MNSDFFKQRRAGILLHPTSLPGTPGNGDLGQHAYRFIDFLADSGISLWQMLPLGPPCEDLSPYQCQSVHAANSLLISLERLVEKGWLSEDASPYSEHELEQALQHLSQQGWHQEEHCETAMCYRLARLKEARTGFEKHASADNRTAFAEFIETQAYWLEDYALFRALQSEHVKSLRSERLRALKEIQDDDALNARLKALEKVNGWWGWEKHLRDRYPQALAEARKRLEEVIEQHRFEQFVFFSQWHELKQYAHEHGVYLFGDIPIFVAQNSVDVWANQDNFLLDTEGQPTVVTGVPPDYFSATGQRWGNPHYNWDYMQSEHFSWWIARLKSAKLLFDLVRIDHFRGFEASWVIPAHCETAIEGHWMQVPGHALFETLQQSNIDLPLVAEDLGIITHEVTALRERFDLPGMKILQFAFDGGPDNPYLPHNHIEHCVVYTGTHDNQTTLGWFQELPVHLQQYVCEYLHTQPHEMPWSLIESAFASVAQLAVVPMQDVLALDGQHRMNVPGVEKGNWRWRFEWSQMPPGVNDKLRHLSHFNERVSADNN
ncbi:MAG: 4-alpha-glucanotransferase [Gammaproteobacteria bacterium]|nr:MAG: 4-alpha-glucanotransferase [Gammaproteobacteria bacterium]